MIYLDHYTASPLRPGVTLAMAAAGQIGGNASSVHQLGRAARRTLQTARGHVQRLLGADAAQDEVIFCGTLAEARSLSVLGLAQRLVGAAKQRAIVFDADTLSNCPGLIQQLCLMGFLVGQLWETEDKPHLVIRRVALGPAKPAPEAPALIRPQDVALLALSALGAHGQCPQWRQIAELFGRNMPPLIVDASLAAGRLHAQDWAHNPAVVYLASAPLGGPPGIAAVVRRRDVDLQPLWAGGGQNYGMRPGTEATMLAAGLGEAARQAHHHCAEEQRRLRGLRGALAADMAPLIVAESCAEALLWPVPAQRLTAYVGRFDAADVMVGWAAKQSPARPACIRLTLGWDTTAAMVDSVRPVLEKVLLGHEDFVCA